MFVVMLYSIGRKSRKLELFRTTAQVRRGGRPARRFAGD
jgi:hypothetical protein